MTFKSAPAPAIAGITRSVVAAALCALLCSAYAAPARASDLEALLACRKVAPSAARLACFDRQSAALAEDVRAGAPPEPAMSAAPAAPAAPPAAAASAPLNPQQTFGLAPMQVAAREEAAEGLPRQLDRMSAHIVAMGRAADGREVFTLDDHQVWTQLEPDQDLIAHAGDAVTISRGLFGSFWMSLPSRQGCKVQRVR